MAKGISSIFILIFALIIIPIISAENITMDYPEIVGIGQEFSFSLELINFSSGIYDVKIDITDIVSGTRIAQILNNGKWKSTYYYITGAIEENEEKEFKLKVVEDFETAGIEIKIRDSSGKTFTFSGYEISKNEDYKKEEGDENNESSDNETNATANDDEEKFDNEEPIVIRIVSKNINNNTEKPIKLETEVIELNALDTKDIKTENNKEKLSKTGNYVLLGFLTFTMLIVTLLSIRTLGKNNKNKNEFR